MNMALLMEAPKGFAAVLSGHQRRQRLSIEPIDRCGSGAWLSWCQLLEACGWFLPCCSMRNRTTVAVMWPRRWRHTMRSTEIRRTPDISYQIDRLIRSAFTTGAVLSLSVIFTRRPSMPMAL